MDRNLQERLVGASILVLIAVLVIPELLSGPRSVSPPPPVFAAPTRIAQPEATRTITVGVGSGPPAPVTAPQKSVTVVAPPPPELPQPRAEPAPRTEPASPAVSAPATTEGVQRGGTWAVQLGSFASAQNANKLLRELTRRGYSAYVVDTQSGGRVQHKVRVGPAADRAAAERILAKLRTDGHSGALIAPSR